MTFPAIFELSNLNGTNGFIINGIDSYDFSGYSVSDAGDINGDGINDLILSAVNATANGKSNAGQSYYIIFGSNGGFNASFDLNSLDGSNGFAIIVVLITLIFLVFLPLRVRLEKLSKIAHLGDRVFLEI